MVSIVSLSEYFINSIDVLFDNQHSVAVSIIFSLLIRHIVIILDDACSLDNVYSLMLLKLQARDNMLKIWTVLSMVRGIAAILGWAFATISPQVDRLRETLENCKENEMAEERGYSNMGFTDGV